MCKWQQFEATDDCDVTAVVEILYASQSYASQ